MDMALPHLIQQLAEVVYDLAASPSGDAERREGIHFRLRPWVDQERALAHGLRIEALERDEQGDLVVWLEERSS